MTWFSSVAPEFQPIASRFAGQRTIYVEIGCWAGESAAWVAQNVLRHPQSHGIGIDPYLPDEPRHPKDEVEQIMATAHARLAPYPNWRWIRQPSGKALRTLRCRRIDLLYIDGDHSAPAVVTDFALAWHYLRRGSVVIFDDYGIGKRKTHRHVPEAIEAIRLAWGDLIQTIHDGPRQYAVQVVRKAMPEQTK